MITRLTLLLLFVAPSLLMGQAPLGFNYQGIAREADGTPIANQEIAIRVNIIDGHQGTGQFEEEHFLTTNDFGLFTAIIGKGNGNGTLNSVNWAGGNLWLQIELDPDNSGYILMGSQQLMSVPYALFAQESGAGFTEGSGISINNGKINNIAPDRPITLIEGTNVTIDSNYPNFTINATGNDEDADPENEIQDLQLAGNNLTITNNSTATPIDLLPYLDNTDTQLTEAEVDAFVNNNGYLTTEVDGSTSNEIQTLSLNGATNNLQLTSGGTVNLGAYLDNTDSQNLSNVLGQGSDAGDVRITNLADPVNPKDVVNLQYLENKIATDYAFKSVINDVGTGAALVFDLTTFDFDEGNLITTTQVSITEAGVYLFTIKGTSTNNALLVVNVNNATDYPVGLINLGTYYDTILLKLSAGDIIELRANTTSGGELITLEFFGYKI